MRVTYYILDVFSTLSLVNVIGQSYYSKVGEGSPLFCIDVWLGK